MFLRQAVRLGLGLAAATVASSWVILAAVHANDRYRVDFVSGTWLALADYASRGTLYPPLYADGYYGGTRYMPLPILLDAGASNLTGELLTSAKLITYIVALVLCGLAFAVLRQVNCSGLLALALLAAVLVTPTGMVGTLGIRNDSVAVAVQLAAVLVALWRQTTRFIVLAGFLAALAIFGKVSAIWAAAAIGLWLLAHRRSLLGPFLAAFGASLAVLSALVEVLSGGRFLTNVTSFAFAGGRGPVSPLTEGVQAVITSFTTHAEATWLLFPIAAVAVIVRLRNPTLLQFALLSNLTVLCVVMASRGTDHNHLLDLSVLTALVVGEFAGSRSEGGDLDVLTLLVAVTILWGVASSYQRMMGPQTLGAVQRVVRGTSETNVPLDVNPLGGFVSRRDRILSQDPTIPLTLGQQPVLLDAFTAKYAFRKHPEWATALAERVAAKEFDKIILVAGLSPASSLYDEQFLGPTVNRAVLANYRLAYAIPDFYVYLPIDRKSS